jgi:hypothetical protein
MGNRRRELRNLKGYCLAELSRSIFLGLSYNTVLSNYIRYFVHIVDLNTNTAKYLCKLTHLSRIHSHRPKARTSAVVELSPGAE